jgi:hypothetical protein
MYICCIFLVNITIPLIHLAKQNGFPKNRSQGHVLLYMDMETGL